ncbi:hypothetical protein ACLDT4_034080 (plasmid) [Mycolicibacterium septicum]|uniref:hypothetical protein n=1 Tax=Mycolicibacterium septicum TaxID=98668 RepID=UPI003CF37499
MDLHDDPQRLVEEYAAQHPQVLGEVHGDLIARYGEVPDRFVDQGANVRPISVSCTVLETVLFSRLRRQSEDSTLKAMAGNGFGIRLVDGNGTQIRVRKHPRKWDGSLLEPVPFVPGGEQFSIEDVLGPLVDEDGIAQPQAYRLYVLWWPGSVGFGGAALAAGLLTKQVQVLYGRTPLPPPIMEQRNVIVTPDGGPAAGPGLGTRRRDDDFAEVDEDAASEEEQEDGPHSS